MVFVIVAKLTAKGEAEADELLAIMTKAAASYRQDPGTLSWHIARGVKDKTQLVAFERASRVQATMLTGQATSRASRSRRTRTQRRDSTNSI